MIPQYRGIITNMTNTKNGFIYIAKNKSADTMAESSARSLRRFHKTEPITLFTDQNNTSSVFSEVIRIPAVCNNSPYLRSKPAYPDQGIIAKALNLGRGETDNTIFLDIDTHICGSLQPVFDVLNDTPGYDIAVCIDEAYCYTGQAPGALIPKCVPRFNTGLVAYRNNEKTKRMFEDFVSIFCEKENGATGNDENSFSAAVYRSDVRVLTLPPEYNCRFIFPFILREAAVVLHGRPNNTTYEHIGEMINKNSGTYRVMYLDKVLSTYRAGIGFTKY